VESSLKAFLWLSIAEINGIKEASEKLNTLYVSYPKLNYCPIRTLIKRCIGSNYQDCDTDWPDNPKCLTLEQLRARQEQLRARYE